MGTEPSFSRGLRWSLTWIVLAFVAAGAGAQLPFDFEETGHFYVQNHPTGDRGGPGGQSFAAVQASNDLVYVANSGGVIEFDGMSWRLIRLPNSGAVFAIETVAIESVAGGTGSRIFVAGYDEIGYLAPDSLGRMGYFSLTDRLSDLGDRKLGMVRSIAATSQAVYFQANEWLIRWDGRDLKVWQAETRFGFCSVLNDTLYIPQVDRGLMRLVDDSLDPAPADALGGRLNARRVPLGDGSYLIVKVGEAVSRCKLRQETACTPFSPDSVGLLAELRPTNAHVLPNGTVVVPTWSGGILLFDRSGNLLRRIDKQSGLLSEAVWHSFLDRQGGLWLSLNDGLARVELGTPLSQWNNEIGVVLDMARHRGGLYLGTSLGLLGLVTGSEGSAPRFEPAPGSETYSTCSSLASTAQGLLAGCSNGFFNLDRRKTILPGIVFDIHRSRKDPRLIYAALDQGLARVRLEDDRWTGLGLMEGLDFQHPQSIAEDSEGTLWVGSGTEGILRLEPADTPGYEPTTTRFGVAEGLPAGQIFVVIVADRIRAFGAMGGLFRLSHQGERRLFVPDTTFDAFLPRGPESIDRLIEDSQGRVWIAADEDSGVAIPTGKGGYRWQPTALRRADMGDEYLLHAEPEQETAWVGTSNGLIRLAGDPAVDTSDYPVWIRRVTTADGSVRYEGLPGDLPTEWPHEDNAVRFEYAAPRFDAPERNQYRVRLDGQDADWSAWTTQPHKEYTNLWEGDYTFRVQARDAYGALSREDRFFFQVLPPWYRSRWAYAGYLVLILTAIWCIYRAAHRAAHRGQQRKLEAEQRVNRRLREVDRLKDEFLAATSHELRTPLYGITGLAESLAGGAKGDLPASVNKDLDLIVSSGRRLSRLVDDILDFSKLRRGDLVLDRHPVDLHSLADIVLTLSRPLAVGKDLDLENAITTDLPPASADERRIQQILHNLVGNAIKFTGSGRVEVRARLQEDQLVVEVSDTGIGIDEADRERIFTAFEQAEGAVDRRFAGTGLGLAVSRRLAEQHGGELWLASSSPEGSTFAFTLPVAVELGVAEEPAEPDRESVLSAPEPSPTDDAVPTLPTGSSVNGNGDIRILVVDDEPVNRRVLANQLGAAGYRIVAAADGPEALRRLEEQRFDLVLLDIMMPRMSGYEVCRELRERYPAEDLPVLFLTAKAQVEDQVAGLAEGANDYLTKPVSRDALLARVRTHVGLLTAYRKQLAGLLPICAQCKKIRDDEGYWEQIESFLSVRSDLVFSHGLCPPCADDALAELKTWKEQYAARTQSPPPLEQPVDNKTAAVEPA